MTEEAQVVPEGLTEQVPPAGEVAPPVPAFVFKHRDSLHFPAAKIKKIMLTDNEVGKIKKESPSLIALCIEMFIEQLISAASEATVQDGAKLLSAGHLISMIGAKRAVLANPKWDFIHNIVANVADLPEAGEEGEAPKRQRKKKEKHEDDGDYVVKKASAKRAGGGGKKGKQNKEEAIAASSTTTSAAMDVPVAQEPDQQPVFVEVSLAPSAQTAPHAPTVVDTDDFDA